MKRHNTREVKIGKLVIGGNNPIWVQSMTKTPTRNITTTLRQIKELEKVGCEIIRVAVFNRQDAICLSEIKKRINLPLVADIHFDYKLALIAIEQGADKIRINPGNIGGSKTSLAKNNIKLNKSLKKERQEKIALIVKSAKDKGISIRIGVNSGSLEKDLLEKYGYPSSEAMVESTLRHIDYFENLGFYDTTISLKATDVQTTIENYRLIAQKCNYPLHLGITEAGISDYGKVKSAIGIGALLLDGIGDTIRVSLTGNPIQEVTTAFDILKASGRRITSPELVSCPECGRIQIDLEKVVKEVERKLKASNFTKPIRISILGCAVNGPGEASEADIGLAGGNREGLIFRKGKVVRKVKEAEMVKALIEEIQKL